MNFNGWFIEGMVDLVLPPGVSGWSLAGVLGRVLDMISILGRRIGLEAKYMRHPRAC